MHESTSNEIEDINFVIRDLQYSSILDVPFYTRLLHNLFSYFGKINALVSAPTYLGYIYYVIIVIQSFFPAFLVDCEDLYPRNSLMTTILSVLGYFYQGPHTSIKSARVPMSIVISVIFIILITILIIRTQHFHKTGRVKSGEIKFIYFMFKYIMPMFCPHLMSGLPISFDQIINQNKIHYNVLQIILSIVTFVFYLYLLYAVITPRVLLEDTPSHDWFPFLTVATITNTTLLTIVSGIAGCVDGKNKSGCSIWMLIQSLSIGLFFFISNGVIKSIINVISSATFFASSFASILLTVNIFISKNISPEVIFIVSIIVLIVLIIVLKILKQIKVTKTLQFIDNFLNSGESLDFVFDNNYKRPFNFLCDIQAVIEIWIEYAGNFELFEIAVSKWPDNFNLLLLYSRLLAIFPDKNEQLFSTVSKISKLDGGTYQTAYLYQFRNLLRRRQTSLSPLFHEKFEQINSKTEVINDTLKRFWESILQKNIVNFWSNSAHVINRLEDLDSLYAQMLDDYPNNYQLLSSYQNYITKIKKDVKEAHEITKKMEILKTNGFIKSNLALENALQVFPQLNNCIHQSQNSNNEQSTTTSAATTTTITSKSQNNDDENDINNNNDALRQINSNQNDIDSNNQLEYAFAELIDNSKLGTIWITSVIIVVVTIVVIVVFYIFIHEFITKFVDKQREAIDFMLNVQMFCHDLNIFCINLNLLPLVLENETVTQISINNRTEFTESVAPKLFAQGKIPEFSLTPESLIDLLSETIQRYSRLTESLSELNNNDVYVDQINYFLYYDKTYESTLNDFTLNIINIALEILKVTTVSEFFEENGLYYDIRKHFVIINQLYSNIAALANYYASSTYDSNNEKLNELMVLVLLITLFFITLPYLIQLFLLIIQSESIAESFTLFPNTEIRSIINDFGKESSKIEKDSTQISSLNNIIGNTKLSTSTTVLTFLSSFIAVLACSLAVSLYAKDFVENAETISHEIYTLTPSFASLSLAFTQALRFYMLLHDGDFEHLIDLDLNFYGSKSDNLSEIVASTFAMLNLSYAQYSEGIWDENGGITSLIEKNQKYFDYFNDSFSNEYKQIFPKKTFFEELATDNFYESISHIQDFLWFYITDVKSSLDLYYETGSEYELLPCGYPILKFPDIIYWFSNFSEINRTQIYFNLVIEDVYDQINSSKIIPETCLYVVIVWQIFACLFMILFLINRHTRIKKSLLFYQYLKPEIVLQNQNVMKMIESGHQISDNNDTTFSNADYIISKISQGVVVTEKNFSITSFNDSFIKKCHLNNENINGEILTDLIIKDDKDKSWPNFIQHVEDSISGKNKTQFKEDVTVKLKSGQVCHFNCSVICLTKNGVSNGSDYDLIEKVAFIFDDNTEIFVKEQLIAQERNHLNKMLMNAMPSRIIQNFVNSSDCISFIVQSVSIGMIRIKVKKNFNKETYEQFTFYDEMFERFDTEIKQYDLLTKISNFSHTYSFVGGLFSEINKPERHAEESIKFALKLLSLVPELSEKFGAEIHLTIGVHTGGPIVAGVLGFDNPTFQIIGTVSEMADQVKNKGVQDQICITRAVYELIFSASFNVQEQGDTKIRGGKIIPTYLVRL